MIQAVPIMVGRWRGSTSAGMMNHILAADVFVNFDKDFRASLNRVRHVLGLNIGPAPYLYTPRCVMQLTSAVRSGFWPTAFRVV